MRLSDNRIDTADGPAVYYFYYFVDFFNYYNYNEATVGLFYIYFEETISGGVSSSNEDHQLSYKVILQASPTGPLY